MNYTEKEEMKIQSPDKIIIEAEKKPVVFLGGTCAESTWREELIPQLEIDYFNPVVEDWTPECKEEEKRQRQTCDYVLYTITPEMSGAYSVAEVVDDSNKRPEKTIFCLIGIGKNNKRYGDAMFTSLCEVKTMVEENGAKTFDTLKEVAEYLNNA